MREIKFRAWFPVYEQMIDVDVLAISPVGWSSDGTGVSLAYQPHIEVMQFTGLRDKYGVEIYERDLVTGISYSDYKTENQVTFLNGCWMFGNWNAHEFFNKHQYIEVIGNIYENPELLGDAK